MTIEDAKQAFARICNAVFPGKETSPARRSRILEKVSKEILKELHLSEKTRFRGDARLRSSCKVYVPYAIFMVV